MKQYTEKDLVSFGNYLLSKERQKSIKATKVDFNMRPASQRMAEVHDADLAKWKSK